LSAFLVHPALSAFLCNAEVAFVSLTDAGGRLATYIPYSREHSR